MTPLFSSALLAAQSDERLLALASAGHDRAFEAIVERYRRPLARYLRRVLSGPLAEDVLQTTFVNAWRSLGRGTDVRELRPWLYRIAHNQAVNALARAEPVGFGLTAVALAVATTAGPETEVEQRDALARALEAVAGLPERQRAALVAVAVEDRPHPDVARELGLTEGALRQLVHRARSSLRAATTAVVPMPLVTAAASAGHDVTIARVAEVAAGAGGAGLGIKTGAAILAVGAFVAGSPTVHEQLPRPGVRPIATAEAGPNASPRSASAEPVLARGSRPGTGPGPRRPATPRGRGRHAPTVRPHGSRRGEDHYPGSGGDGAAGRSPHEREHHGTSSGSSGDGSDSSNAPAADSSRPGSGGGSLRPETSTEPAETSGSGHSGSASGDALEPSHPTATTLDPVVPAVDDSSGEGSGSGSTSSGSGGPLPASG